MVTPARPFAQEEEQVFRNPVASLQRTRFSKPRRVSWAALARFDDPAPSIPKNEIDHQGLTRPLGATKNQPRSRRENSWTQKNADTLEQVFDDVSLLILSDPSRIIEPEIRSWMEIYSRIGFNPSPRELSQSSHASPKGRGESPSNFLFPLLMGEGWRLDKPSQGGWGWLIRSAWHIFHPCNFGIWDASKEAGSLCPSIADHILIHPLGWVPIWFSLCVSAVNRRFQV